MKNYKLFSLAAIAILGLTVIITSCAKEDSVDVNQDKIYTDYEVFYNKNTDKSWVVAKFRFGGPTGTILELTDGAHVLFGSDTLPYVGWAGGHFKEYAGRITSGTFSYTDVDGSNFMNSIPGVDTLAWPASFDTIDKSVANTLAWDGPVLAANEHVGVFIGSSWAWGEDALFVQAADGANDIVMGITQLENLATGPATGYMDRTTDVAVSQGTSEGGRIRAKYRATNATLQVVD